MSHLESGARGGRGRVLTPPPWKMTLLTQSFLRQATHKHLEHQIGADNEVSSGIMLLEHANKAPIFKPPPWSLYGWSTGGQPKNISTCFAPHDELPESLSEGMCTCFGGYPMGFSAQLFFSRKAQKRIFSASGGGEVRGGIWLALKRSRGASLAPMHYQSMDFLDMSLLIYRLAPLTRN